MTAGCRTGRFQPFRAAAVLVTTLTACWAQAQPVPAMTHVRSDDALIAGLIAEAPTRSETFRRLVVEIETTNGIVYVEAGKCRFGVRACLIHSIDVAGPSRILRMAKDPNARAFSGREVSFADGSTMMFGPTADEADRWSCGTGPCVYTYPDVRPQ